jgi:hypothetical protein
MDRDHEYQIVLTAIDDLEVAEGRDDPVVLPPLRPLQDRLLDLRGGDSSFDHANPRVAAEEDSHVPCSTGDYMCITGNTVGKVRRFGRLEEWSSCSREDLNRLKGRRSARQD